MSPKLKKILKWIGLFYLAMFVLGIVSMTFEHFGINLAPKHRSAARSRDDAYRRTFDGPFVDSYDAQGYRKAALKLHFLKSGAAVCEYRTGSYAVTMDLFDYKAEGESIELTGVERFVVNTHHDDMGRSYNTFRRTGRRPDDMRAEPLLSKRGRDIRVFAEGIGNPIRFHQSTPVKNLNKRTQLSREGVFVLDLYNGAYADRMSKVWVVNKGDYDLLTSYPGADSVDAHIVGDQQQLLALMERRDMRGEPFDVTDRRVAYKEWTAELDGAFNGLWAGPNAAWAFLPLTAVIVILGFLSIAGYGEPDERRYRMLLGMSLFHRICLATVMISSLLIIWYVASLGHMCLWFLSAGLPFSIINALLVLVFCSLLCTMIDVEHVELTCLYGLREPGGKWVEALVAYGLVAMATFGIINSAFASDGMELPSPQRTLGIYMLLILVTLPRTLLRINRSEGPKALLLPFFLLCYPLRYPLFVFHLISGVINGVGSIKSADTDEEEPDHFYVTSSNGDSVQIFKLPNGDYMDNDSKRWSGSGGNYHRVGDGTPYHSDR